MPTCPSRPNLFSQSVSPRYPADVAGNGQSASRLPCSSSTTTWWVSLWASTPAMIAGCRPVRVAVILDMSPSPSSWRMTAPGRANTSVTGHSCSTGSYEVTSPLGPVTRNSDGPARVDASVPGQPAGVSSSVSQTRPEPSPISSLSAGHSRTRRPNRCEATGVAIGFGSVLSTARTCPKGTLTDTSKRLQLDVEDQVLPVVLRGSVTDPLAKTISSEGPRAAADHQLPFR
jgi:hypothetical protein